MSNELHFDGLNELRELLASLPEHLRAGVSDIVVQHARSAAEDVRNGYPSRTGHLRAGVRVETQQHGLYLSATVKSAAPHATLFERGTVVRHNHRGASRGRMPPAPESQRFIPKAIRWRQRMVAALISYVIGEGFEVAA